MTLLLTAAAHKHYLHRGTRATETITSFPDTLLFHGSGGCYPDVAVNVGTPSFASWLSLPLDWPELFLLFTTH